MQLFWKLAWNPSIFEINYNSLKCLGNLECSKHIFMFESVRETPSLRTKVELYAQCCKLLSTLTPEAASSSYPVLLLFV